MGLFERWLSLWVGLSILAGLALGALAPGVFAALAALEVASVSASVDQPEGHKRGAIPSAKEAGSDRARNFGRPKRFL